MTMADVGETDFAVIVYQEEDQWEHYQFLKHLVRMAKAKASLKSGIRPELNA